MAVHAKPEVVSVPIMPFGRGMRLDLKTPSAFIEDYYVNGPERWFEEWLYRRGFRPAWDNYLGKTIEQYGVDENTLDTYFEDKFGFACHAEMSSMPWDSWRVAEFASCITRIKRIVQVPWPGEERTGFVT